MSPSRAIIDVHQDTSGKYSAQLVDQNLAALDSTIVESITLTLYDTKTEDIINSRDAQDVLNTNQVTIDCDGTLVWDWTSLDMPLLSTTKDQELHTALFTIVWNGGF